MCDEVAPHRGCVTRYWRQGLPFTVTPDGFFVFRILLQADHFVIAAELYL